MTFWKRAAGGLLAVLWFGHAVAAQAGEPPRVVADIAPVQSLVAQVMEDVATPDLLLGAASSPHDYSMKPSDARKLAAADLVVWTGPVLTPWLQDALDALTPKALRITFSELDGVTLLPFRNGSRFDHGDPVGDHDHAGAVDGHIWLDPQNAAVLVRAVADKLSALDPDNASRYQQNAQRTLDRLARLQSDIEADLAPLRARPYVVFHDAYHYFEARFDIPAAGAISISDSVRPGAKRLREVRGLIADAGVVCAFAEPQFAPKLLQGLVSGTEIRTGVLDPIGSHIAPGPAEYDALLRGLAAGLSDCLAP